jgi:hypothetical protein
MGECSVYKVNVRLVEPTAVAMKQFYVRLFYIPGDKTPYNFNVPSVNTNPNIIQPILPRKQMRLSPTLQTSPTLATDIKLCRPYQKQSSQLGWQSKYNNNNNSGAVVRLRTIPTERTPSVGESEYKVRNKICYKYHVFGHCPSSCPYLKTPHYLFFKTQRFGDWILSPEVRR